LLYVVILIKGKASKSLAPGFESWRAHHIP
jgi:hypothetical protein